MPIDSVELGVVTSTVVGSVSVIVGNAASAVGVPSRLVGSIVVGPVVGGSNVLPTNSLTGL